MLVGATIRWHPLLIGKINFLLENLILTIIQLNPAHLQVISGKIELKRAILVQKQLYLGVFKLKVGDIRCN